MCADGSKRLGRPGEEQVVQGLGTKQGVATESILFGLKGDRDGQWRDKESLGSSRRPKRMRRARCSPDRYERSKKLSSDWDSLSWIQDWALAEKSRRLNP